MLSLLPFLALASGMELIASLPDSEQAFIVEQIESRLEPLSGPGIIVDFSELPISGSDETASLVLYTYQSGENRDRSGATFLTLVQDNEGVFSSTPPLLIGLNGRRVIDAMKVAGSEIILTGRYWSAGDPQCCPSAIAETRVVFDGERLVEMGGHWERQETDQ